MFRIIPIERFSLLRGLAFLSQEPFIELRVGVGLGPGIVTDAWIDGEFDRRTRRLECVDRFLLVGELHHIVLVAVKSPEGNVRNLRFVGPTIAMATNGRRGGEALYA